jgi:ribose transport system ATP-binding protein
MNEKKPILHVTNITKTFGDTVALRNVNFNLYSGEVHCLVGENGAGKSTLIKLLSGAETPDRGIISVFGRDYTLLHPDWAMSLGIATIYQDVELIESLNVADNIFLGHEFRNRLGVINFRKQFEAARELMDRVKISIPERAIVEGLSPAQKQMLQIVKALHIQAKVMIMDEPTSSLGRDETKALMKLTKELTRHDIGVIYISHYLDEVFEIGDRVTVLKDGEVVSTYDVKTVDMDTVATAMVGRKPSLFFQREKVDIGEVVLEVKNVTKQGVVEDVSFEVRKGEIFGIGGIVGAGRTELMRILFGVDEYDSGSILLNGRMLESRTPRDAIDSGFSMIMEERKALSLFDIRPIKENISIVHNERERVLIKHKDENRLVNGLLQRLSIVSSGLEQPAGYLSGGNQQKSVLARWLLTDAQVYIFDEPTKGVDIGAKEQIYSFMIELIKRGKAIIMVSSDMPELISMSDSIGVMRGGRMVAVLNAEEVTEKKLLDYFLGLESMKEGTT